MVVAFSRPPTPSRQSPAQEQREVQNAHTENATGSTATHPLKDNGVVARKPRGRQVSSRYLSPSPSASSSSTTAGTKTTRFPSPLVSRSTNSTSSSTPKPTMLSSLPKRSQSVDRRRSGTPVPQGNGNASELSAATKMLITSTRSLSVSFQGEAFSLPISKTKEQPAPALSRKPTPERRRATPVRDQGENSKPMDQQRWPARSRQANMSSNALCRSLDCSNERKKLGGFGSGVMGMNSLQQSMMLDDSNRRLSFDGGSRLSLDLGNAELLRDTRQNPDANSVNETSSVSCDLTTSDTDSVSSGSTNSGAQECGGGGLLRGKSVPRGIVVSARFWQETNSRLRRLQDPGSPVSTSPASRIGAPSKLSQSKRFSSDGVTSSPRTMASPVRGATRPASPSKLWTSSASSPSRGLSPARVRSVIGGQMSGNSANTPSILSFSVDIRRGKIGEDRIVDAHLLRLLYNRYLQWRFVNARADSTFMVQTLNAENNLWNAWVTISELRDSVTLKRIKLLLLRQKLKRTSILKGQMPCLEEWALLDRDHYSSLLGATEALKASTLRLPIVGNAMVDIQNLKDAIGSAVDVMQAMASSICLPSSKVEEMNALVAELMNVTAKEKAMLEQCRDFLSTIAAMQVKDCSLRTHITQLGRLSTTSSLTTHV